MVARIHGRNMMLNAGSPSVGVTNGVTPNAGVGAIAADSNHLPANSCSTGTSTGSNATGGYFSNENAISLCYTAAAKYLEHQSDNRIQKAGIQKVTAAALSAVARFPPYSYEFATNLQANQIPLQHVAHSLG